MGYPDEKISFDFSNFSIQNLNEIIDICEREKEKRKKMTALDKFKREYVLYSRLSDHETIFELWGGSTKHPDSVFYFSDFKLSDLVDSQSQIFQWGFECASKMNFPSHAIRIVKWFLKFLK